MVPPILKSEFGLRLCCRFWDGLADGEPELPPPPPELFSSCTESPLTSALPPSGSPGSTAAASESVTTMAEYINSRATTIYGGTAEIQRSIIAKHVLGL